jgi:hypothetical protein
MIAGTTARSLQPAMTTDTAIKRQVQRLLTLGVNQQFLVRELKIMSKAALSRWLNDDKDARPINADEMDRLAAYIVRLAEATVDPSSPVGERARLIAVARELPLSLCGVGRRGLEELSQHAAPGNDDVSSGAHSTSRAPTGPPAPEASSAAKESSVVRGRRR